MKNTCGLIWPKLAEAYVALDDITQAKAVIARLGAWLEANAPAKDAARQQLFKYNERCAIREELLAAFAKLEKRPKDAAEAYQRLLRFRPGWDTLEERFATIDNAAALWKDGGGNEEAWKEWLVAFSGTISQPATKWDSIERSLPEFGLVDLTGRKWTRADLQGKTVLVNFWATWCPPCVAELPYIQKLQTALKDRDETLVLTFNVDENPGVIEPFLARQGLTGLIVIPAHEFVLTTLGMNGFPRTWIIDADGVARRQQSGFTSQPVLWLKSVTALLSQ